MNIEKALLNTRMKEIIFQKLFLFCLADQIASAKDFPAIEADKSKNQCDKHK